MQWTMEYTLTAGMPMGPASIILDRRTPFTQYISSGGVDIVCVRRVSSVLTVINEVCLLKLLNYLHIHCTCSFGGVI